ncbi:MAG: Arginine/ornithine antiporter ArcD [uncultured Sulfurovum sp.]|uniref:Arginine/ornithine antiporter ArcD n=1 Tax=uncultured Sulfurovum sp. TaxID=269237 RepID=A0A6S6SW96_9BACT|nr:MAG: Arginine/ornithine antiporter ArcD [uncultured Sulfurovum sp.]
MEDTLTSLSTWGYLALAFFSFGGSLVVVAAAGVLSYMGEMNLYISLGIAIVFNYIGDMFLFYLGKYHKADIKPYFEKHKRKIALSTLILRKYGVLAIFIQKFLYGIKTLIPLSMAISRYDFRKFGFYNVFASIFFVLVIMLSAFYAGETIKQLFESFKEYPWVPFVILFAVVLTIWYGMGHLTKRK